MAEDLGTWPPEQATVLLEVLIDAGLAPEAKRTREGVIVTVPDEQSDDAHRQLVANMDRIASAARQPRSKGSGGGGNRRARPVKGADNPQPKDPQQAAQDRMQRLVRPLGFLLLGLILLATVGRVSLPIALAVLAVMIYVIGKRAQQQGGGSGGSGSGGPLR